MTEDPIPYLDRPNGPAKPNTAASIATKLEQLERQRDLLRAALAEALVVVDNARGQWGDDYLWEKWGLDVHVHAARRMAKEAEAW